MHWSGGVLNAETSGYFLGTLLTPILLVVFVVWLINRGRKEKMSAIHKHLLAASLAFIISGLSFVGSTRGTGGFDENSAKREMGHLLRQAAGTEAATPDSQWYQGPSREFFHDILVFNQEYADKIHSLDRSSVAKLYTPESYTTRAGMQVTVSQLQALWDVDQKYESVEPILKSLESKISVSAASDAQKADFLTGFRNSSNKSLAPRSATFRDEQEWLQSSIGLYEFTLAHFKDYTVKDKKLIFRNDSLRLEFQDRQSKSMDLRRLLREAQQQFVVARKHAMSQVGVTPADISPSPAAKVN